MSSDLLGERIKTMTIATYQDEPIVPHHIALLIVELRNAITDDRLLLQRNAGDANALFQTVNAWQRLANQLMIEAGLSEVYGVESPDEGIDSVDVAPNKEDLARLFNAKMRGE